MTDSDSLRGDLPTTVLAGYPASFTSLEAPASPLEALANEMNLGGGRACPMRAQYLLRAGMKALRGHDFSPDLKAAQTAEFELEHTTPREARYSSRDPDQPSSDHKGNTGRGDMTPEAVREEYERIAQDVDGASIQMQRVVNDDSPIDQEDIDGDLKQLREQVRRLESLRAHVPEPKPATPQDG